MPATPADSRHPGEVFRAFLKLGLTSFGGPVAHLGYFRNELVLRRRWLDDDAYADLVALCQFLPGPASSQVGFALGLLRGGALGALAAWAAFTLPSAAILIAFAVYAGALGGTAGSALVHSLKVVAVAIVAQAVWGMARSLAPDRTRASIGLAALILVMAAPTAIGQIAAIAAGALAGFLVCRNGDGGMTRKPPLRLRISRPAAAVALTIFVALLLAAPILARGTGSHAAAMFAAFYRSGALVFGGGHVVLPLLRAAVVDPGWVSSNAFLAGYGLAQAIPGPLFTFAAYLGAADTASPGWLVGGAIALAAIFLPGFLLLLGVLPFWDKLRSIPSAQAAMRGTNAAVVGILGAALYDPVWTGGIQEPRDFALAAGGFVLLTTWKAPPWLVVLLIVAGGVIGAVL